MACGKPHCECNDKTPTPPRCVLCHLELEERQVFPLLPPAIAWWLQGQHDYFRRLMSVGMLDMRTLIDHAALENEVFPHYVRAELADSLIADHDSYEHGLTPFVDCGNHGDAFGAGVGIRAGVQPIGSGGAAPGSYFGAAPFARVPYGYFGPSRLQASPHHRKAMLPGYFGAGASALGLQLAAQAGDGLAPFCARMYGSGRCATGAGAAARREMCEAAGFDPVAHFGVAPVIAHDPQPAPGLPYHMVAALRRDAGEPSWIGVAGAGCAAGEREACAMLQAAGIGERELVQFLTWRDQQARAAGYTWGRYGFNPQPDPPKGSTFVPPGIHPRS